MSHGVAHLDLDLHTRRGEFELRLTARLDAPVVGVLGASGAGKTTLLEALAGLLPGRVTGRITLGETVLLDSAAGVDLPPEQRRIGYVFQDGLLFPHLDVRGNLCFGQRGEGELSLERVVEALELEPLLLRLPSELSGGERQRVALGRALLAEPRLLLLDEPLAGADTARKRRILGLIARVRDAFGVPMLYVGHDLSEVLSLTHRLLLLEGGKLVAQGELGELAREPAALRLASSLGLDNALEVEVTAHDAENGVVRARCGQAELSLPVGQAVEAGERWTIHLRPEDVILARGDVEPPTLSARNRLRGQLTRIVEVDERVFVELREDGFSLRAEVTRGALRDLELSEGSPVWALFKASALRWGFRR